MKAIAAYMASRSTNREDGSERRNEPGRREYENRRSEYEGTENRIYSAGRDRQPNQYPQRSEMGEDWPDGNEMRRRRDSAGRYKNDYDGGVQSRYRGRDGRWRAGTRRSEQGGGAYGNDPMDRRMGDDEGDEKEEVKEYGVTVKPQNVIQWPYMPGVPHLPPEGRMIGFGNGAREYENRSHYGGADAALGEQTQGMHGMAQGEEDTLDKHTMEKWVNHMRDDKDKPIEPWSEEEIKPLATRFGYPTSGEKFDNFYTAVHMMKSDFCAVGEDFDVDVPAFYAALADAWLRDPDAAIQNREKLEAYYKYIVRGKR